MSESLSWSLVDEVGERKVRTPTGGRLANGEAR